MNMLIRLTIVLAIIIGVAVKADAKWKGPFEVVKLGWGNDATQTALSHGDAEENQFTEIFAIDKDGNILLADAGNVRLQIFSSNGKLIKSIKPVNLPSNIFGWPLGLTVLSNAQVMIKRGDKYQIYNYEGRLTREFIGVATHIYEIEALSDDSIIAYKSDNNTYYQYSRTGQLIKTSSARPIELGIVSEKYMAPGQYKVTVKYPDREWEIVGPGAFPKYVRDKDGNLYGLGEAQVSMYASTGKELANLTMPKGKVQEISRGHAIEPKVKTLEEYGSPVVAPSGEVYTWKYTPDKYSIIKWIWVDGNN